MMSRMRMEKDIFTNDYFIYNAKGTSLFTIKKKEEKSHVPLLAIDGGATKTVAVIADEKGNVLASSEAGSSNYHVVGKTAAIRTLKTVIRNAINSLNVKSNIFDIGIFALAGIDTEADQINVAKIVKEVLVALNIHFNKLIVENDALSVLFGMTKGDPGAILIAGTGAIASAYDGGNIPVRGGGWGHKVGDEGSGYWIGKEAIRAILKSYDGRGSDTVLSKNVLQHLDLKNDKELYNWVYSEERSIHHIAALAVFVAKAARDGDHVSKSIIECAIDELFLLIDSTVRKAGISDRSFKLLFLGGILQNNHYVRSRLTDLVSREIPQAEIIANKKKPIEFIIERGLMGLR